jgi:hypothetical protein
MTDTKEDILEEEEKYPINKEDDLVYDNIHPHVDELDSAQGGFASCIRKGSLNPASMQTPNSSPISTSQCTGDIVASQQCTGFFGFDETSSNQNQGQFQQNDSHDFTPTKIQKTLLCSRFGVVKTALETLALTVDKIKQESRKLNCFKYSDNEIYNNNEKQISNWLNKQSIIKNKQIGKMFLEKNEELDAQWATLQDDDSMSSFESDDNEIETIEDSSDDNDLTDLIQAPSGLDLGSDDDLIVEELDDSYDFMLESTKLSHITETFNVMGEAAKDLSDVFYTLIVASCKNKNRAFRDWLKEYVNHLCDQFNIIPKSLKDAVFGVRQYIVQSITCNRDAFKKSKAFKAMLGVGGAKLWSSIVNNFKSIPYYVGDSVWLAAILLTNLWNAVPPLPNWWPSCSDVNARFKLLYKLLKKIAHGRLTYYYIPTQVNKFDFIHFSALTMAVIRIFGAVHLPLALFLNVIPVLIVKYIKNVSSATNISNNIVRRKVVKCEQLKIQAINDSVNALHRPFMHMLHLTPQFEVYRPLKSERESSNMIDCLAIHSFIGVSQFIFEPYAGTATFSYARLALGVGTCKFYFCEINHDRIQELRRVWSKHDVTFQQPLNLNTFTVYYDPPWTMGVDGKYRIPLLLLNAAIVVIKLPNTQGITQCMQTYVNRYCYYMAGYKCDYFIAAIIEITNQTDRIIPLLKTVNNAVCYCYPRNKPIFNSLSHTRVDHWMSTNFTWKVVQNNNNIVYEDIQMQLFFVYFSFMSYIGRHARYIFIMGCEGGNALSIIINYYRNNNFIVFSDILPNIDAHQRNYDYVNKNGNYDDVHNYLQTHQINGNYAILGDYRTGTNDLMKNAQLIPNNWPVRLRAIDIRWNSTQGFGMYNSNVQGYCVPFTAYMAGECRMLVTHQRPNQLMHTSPYIKENIKAFNYARIMGDYKLNCVKASLDEFLISKLNMLLCNSPNCRELWCNQHQPLTTNKWFGKITNMLIKNYGAGKVKQRFGNELFTGNRYNKEYIKLLKDLGDSKEDVLKTSLPLTIRPHGSAIIDVDLKKEELDDLFKLFPKLKGKLIYLKNRASNNNHRMLRVLRTAAENYVVDLMNDNDIVYFNTTTRCRFYGKNLQFSVGTISLMDNCKNDKPATKYWCDCSPINKCNFWCGDKKLKSCMITDSVYYMSDSEISRCAFLHKTAYFVFHQFEDTTIYYESLVYKRGNQVTHAVIDGETFTHRIVQYFNYNYHKYKGGYVKVMVLKEDYKTGLKIYQVQYTTAKPTEQRLRPKIHEEVLVEKYATNIAQSLLSLNPQTSRLSNVIWSAISRKKGDEPIIPFKLGPKVYTKVYDKLVEQWSRGRNVSEHYGKFLETFKTGEWTYLHRFKIKCKYTYNNMDLRQKSVALLSFITIISYLAYVLNGNIKLDVVKYLKYVDKAYNVLTVAVIHVSLSKYLKFLCCFIPEEENIINSIKVDSGTIMKEGNQYNTQVELGSFCTSMVTITPQDPFADIYIPTCNIRQGNAEPMDGLPCEERYTYKSYGPVTRYTGSYTSCKHSGVSALLNRETFSAFAKYGTQLASKMKIKPLVDFVFNNFDEIYIGHDHVQIMDYDKWLLTQKPIKREIHVEDSETALYELIFSEDPRMIKRMLRRKGFSKLELIHKLDIQKAHNRLVQANGDKINCLIGPSAYAFCKYLQYLLGGPIEPDINNNHDLNREDVVYASGRTRGTLGDFMKMWIDEFGEFDIYEFDEGRHDFHQKSCLMELFKDVFVKVMKLDGSENPAHKAIIDWLDSRIEASEGYMTGGVFWRMIATLGSGDNHTTAYNTHIIMLKMIFAAHLTRRHFKLTKQERIFHALSLGDDNYSVVKKLFSSVFVSNVKAVADMLEFDTDVIKTNVMYGAFCSSTFVPCLINGQPTYYLTPRFGKILSRTYYSFKSWGDKNAVHYAREISQCMLLDFKHVEIFRDFFLHILSLCGVDKVSTLKVQRFVRRKFAHKEIVFGSTDKQVEPAPNTHDFIKQKYFLDEKMISEFKNCYQKMTTPFAVLDCTLIDHVFAVDMLGVTEVDQLQLKLQDFHNKDINNHHDMLYHNCEQWFHEKVHISGEENGGVIPYEKYDKETKKVLRLVLNSNLECH